MRLLLSIAFAALVVYGTASAQPAGADDGTSTDSTTADAPTGKAATTLQEFVSRTTSERTHLYIVGALGPGATLRAATAGGLAQWAETPTEWGGGPEAYGDRFGNAVAEHVIREALEFGGSYALHEDNRCFRSTETGFLKRSKHAGVSIFVARNEAGSEHFAHSRFGSVLGSSFSSGSGNRAARTAPEMQP